MKIIWRIILISVLSFSFQACNQVRKVDTNRAQKIIKDIKDPKVKKAFVVAHRADWRHAPENSLKAIQNCIDMGVDVVELDIRMTKDSVFVLMHDEKVDRTTSGKGLLVSYTLDSLKTLRLRSGNGFKTHHQVPTLDEVLKLCKNKIVIDFDVKDALMDLLLTKINEHEFMDQSIFFGYTNGEQTQNRMGKELNNVVYTSGMSSKTKNPKKFLNSFISSGYIPHIIAPKFAKDNDILVGYFDDIKEMGSRIWIHTITASRSGNHHDNLAVDDADAAYGWLIDRGVTVFQTDRPELLLNYLRSKGLHD